MHQPGNANLNSKLKWAFPDTHGCIAVATSQICLDLVAAGLFIKRRFRTVQKEQGKFVSFFKFSLIS